MAGSIGNQNILKTILVAGLVAGTLDISAAFVQSYIDGGHSPDFILKIIAGGVFGIPKALAGGWEMAAVGLLCHYIIAFSLAAFFVFLYLNWFGLRKHIVLVGILYGIFAWIVTTRIIIPYLSKIKPRPFNLDKALIAIAILIFMIGLPIALITHAYLRNKMVRAKA